MMAARRERQPKQGKQRTTVRFYHSGGYAPKLLELVEQALDTVSILIGPKVATGGSFRFAFGGITGLIPWVSSSSRRKSLS